MPITKTVASFFIMAAPTSHEAVSSFIEDIVEQFGPDESRQILTAASGRLASSDGGTAKDWYAALTAAILERHPDLDVTDRPN